MVRFCHVSNIKFYGISSYFLLTFIYSRYIDSDHAKKITSIIYMSLTNEAPSSTTVSAQLLNKALLRSANFYEAKCFKGEIKLILEI